MKISAIETTIVKIPNIGVGPGGSRSSDVLLVEVRTDDGRSGWGEAFGFNASVGTKAVIDDVIAPLAVGMDASDIEGLTTHLHRRLHIFGRGGPLVFGVAGIDIALWDLAAKAAGVPLCTLLCTSGAPKETIPIYASLPRSGDTSLTENVARALDEGYRAVKLHETTVAKVREAREVAGPGIPIMVDTNCPWTLDQAIDMAEQLEPFDLYWLEEPVWPPEDAEALATLRTATSIPIAAGENVPNALDFKRMFALGSLDFAQPSVTKIGGITEMRKVFAYADEANVNVAPHSPYFGPGFLATLHVIAAREQETIFERYHVERAASFFGTLVDPVGGRLRVPAGPGLGCDPDPEVIARYRVDDPRVSVR